jgi:two-component system chemotaxis response regulator CheB
MNFSFKHIIVVGASAGGFHSIGEFLSALPSDFNLPVFIVLHLSKDSDATIIKEHLQRKTHLRCEIAENGKEIEAVVYIAPPDRHLMIDDQGICLNQAPSQNYWRPSIDVLFRSAASTYNSKVIGIVFSGLLDDGTAGMDAIKRCGGICIVQEPQEAEFSDMPLNVLKKVEVDYRAAVSDISYILEDIFSKPSRAETKVPEDIRLEAEMTRNATNNMNNLDRLGTQSPYTCPDCGGSLWHIKEGKPHRFRCYTGHVYNENVLIAKQLDAIEESLWISIRMLEERRNLLLTSAGYELEQNNLKEEKSKIEKANEIIAHIEKIKSLIETIKQK